MPLANIDIFLDQGADYNTIYTWSAGTPPLPVNLTGATAQMLIHSLPSDVTPLMVLSTTASANGSIVIGAIPGSASIDPTNGNVQVNFTKAGTLALANAINPATAAQFGKCLYDLLITVGGITTEFMGGFVLLRLTQPWTSSINPLPGPPAVITTSYTMQAIDVWLRVAAGAVITMPATPILGFEYVITAVSGTLETNPVTVNGNGYQVMDPNPQSPYAQANTVAMKVSQESVRWRWNGTLMVLA